MTDLLINPRSSQRLKFYKSNLPQSLLLTGPEGVGLYTIALDLANNSPVAVLRPVDKDGVVTVRGGTIPVAAIRDMYDMTRSKSKHSQVVVIDDADAMSPGAQNAFLKLLEEPGESVHFILTSHQPTKLLPTVISRVERVNLSKIDLTKSEKLVDKLGVKDDNKKRQLMFVGGGLPAELHRLAADEAYFKTIAGQMADARELLQAPAYSKLLVINRYSSDRQKTLDLLQSAQKIIELSQQDSPSREAIERSDQIATVYDRIIANGNVRLQLLILVV